MIALNDIAEANRLLVSLGGEDQMPRIAAAAIERSLELQHRVDRALAYAQAAPPASMHARQMARILDGSITLDDEAQEMAEQHPLPHQQPRRLQAAEPKVPKRRGPGRVASGLAGKGTKYRRDFREWVGGYGVHLHQNKAVPQVLTDAYDRWLAGRRDAAQEAVLGWIREQGGQGEPEGRLFGG